MLVNNLEEACEQLIRPFQYAVVGGLQILNAVLIANEEADRQLKSRAQGVICELELDMKKRITISTGPLVFLDVAWVSMEQVGPEIAALNGLWMQGYVKWLVHALPLTVFWVLWRECNHRYNF